MLFSGNMFAANDECAAVAAAVVFFFLGFPSREGGFKLLWVCLCVRSSGVSWNLGVVDGNGTAA